MSQSHFFVIYWSVRCCICFSDDSVWCQPCDFASVLIRPCYSDSVLVFAPAYVSTEVRCLYWSILCFILLKYNCTKRIDCTCFSITISNKLLNIMQLFLQAMLSMLVYILPHCQMSIFLIKYFNEKCWCLYMYTCRWCTVWWDRSCY